MSQTSPVPGPQGLGPALIEILALAPDEVAQTVRDEISQLSRTIHEAALETANNAAADQVLGEWFHAAGQSLLDVLKAGQLRPDRAPAAPLPAEAADAPERQAADVARDEEPVAPAGESAPQETEAPAPAATPARAPAPAPEERVDEALGKLWDRLADDTHTREYARAYLAQAHSDEPRQRACQRWERLHLLCLRLAAPDAQKWRREAALAVAGESSDGGDEPSPAAEVPDLPELGYQGPGVLDEQDPLPGDLAAATARLGPESMDLARLAAAASWLNEHDPLTRNPGWSTHALYHKALFDQITNLADEQDKGGVEGEFGKAVQLDSAIRSVVPIPFPQSGSWWLDHLDRLMRAISVYKNHEWIESPQQLVGQPFNGLLSGKKIDGHDSCGISPDEKNIGSVGLLRGNVAWVLRLGYRDKASHYHPAWVVYVKSQ